MNQQKLEKKVAELFEKQGFDVEKEENELTAEQNEQELGLKIFSSEEFSSEEVLESVFEGEKVFLDEGLEKVKNELDNQVSVIKEEGSEEYELPSYELIGEIAVINELTVDEDEAVEGILNHHPSVKTILLKEEPLQGEFRVGEYEKLYGEETETVHKEFGCRFKVDPTKVYYSERFSTERKRVVDQIEDGEKVLVMFAGVGPFAIMAAKLANPEKVVAIEKNPVAANCLNENIELNDVEDVVEGYEEDVRKIIPGLDEKFDRIIMPLPERAEKFLDLVGKITGENSIIHLYNFLEEKFEPKFEDFEILDCFSCGERGPSVKRVCIDLRSKTCSQ